MPKRSATQFETMVDFLERHVVHICEKAFRNLAFVLYEAFVKSHLEYIAAIWNPSEGKIRICFKEFKTNSFDSFI
ncbi:hypothetical protein SFRURICE_003746 [Spodoptera frugiperda]|nr:hypothetical protein SFRURICE_003746 [Spodoptera frugiperda]